MIENTSVNELAAKQLLNSRQTAKLLGISWQRLGALAKEGRITRNEDGKYDPEQVRAEFEASKDPVRPSKLGLAGDYPSLERGYHQIRTEHEDLRRQMTANQLAIDEGRIIETDYVVGTVGELLKSISNGVLAMGSKLAPVLAMETNAAVIQGMMADEGHKLLSELSRWKPSTKPAPIG